MPSKKTQKPKRVGKQLGSGCSKTCFAYGKGEVALIPLDPDGTRLRLEYEALQTLKEAGIPVVRFRMGKVRAGGQVYDALIEKRWPNHYITPGDGPLPEGVLKSLVKLAHQLKKAQLEICDFQFLWSKNGRIAVCDPYSVERIGKKQRNGSAREILSIANNPRNTGRTW